MATSKSWASWLPAEWKWVLPVVTILGLLSFFFEALGIYLIVPLIEQLIPRSDSSTIGIVASVFPRGTSIVTMIVAIVACIMLKAATSLLSASIVLWSSGKVCHDMRVRTFDKILTGDERLYSEYEPGVLLNVVANETWRAGEGLQALTALVTHCSALVVFVALMLYLSPSLTLAVVVGLLIILGLLRLTAAASKRVGTLAVSANQRLAARITQGLDGLSTIRLFGRETYEADRFEASSEKARSVFWRLDVLNALPAPAFDVLFAILLGVLIIGLQSTSVAILIAFLALLQRMQPHAVAVMHSRLKLSSLGAARDSVDELLQTTNHKFENAGHLPAIAPNESLSLTNVTLQYPNSAQKALDNITLHVPASKTTALVGRSGAGKSTVVRLLCRLVDPDSGRVSVDGTDLREIDQAAWRLGCSVVPQDVFLFDASIIDNIAYGRSGASKDEVVQVAKAAQAHDFISMLPHGYDERVGDRGSRLSGGQRQRIALARALLRKAPILVLDEATNALDQLSQRLVEDALRASDERTVILVAHQLSSVERADYVIVMDKGRVVEEGSPASLRAKQGDFTRLFDLTKEAS